MGSNSKTQKRIQLAIHLCAWLYVFITPIIFKGPREHFSWALYFRGCVTPLLSVGVFYLNYLFLVKRYYISRQWVHFLGYNLAVISAAVVIQELLINLLFRPMMTPPPPIEAIRPHPHYLLVAMFSFRGFFTYTFLTATAVALRLSLIWHSNEMDRQQAELNNLKSQLNPHFLLNTLNNIYSLTTFDQQKAQEAILQLSKMLRYMLYEDSARPVKLLREIEFLEQYIALMKLRLASNVEVSLHTVLPPNCQHEVMPNIFISLVENAFKHGISATAPSFIHVDCVHDDAGTIHFRVTNSNFPKNKAEKVPGGIGLQQVSRRLELLYPGLYSWQHGPSPDGKIYTAEIELRNP